MNLTFNSYELQFRYPFRITHGTRSATPVVFVEISEENLIGYGEAALPPYLPENTETVIQFLKKINFKNFKISDGVEKIIDYVNSLESGNFAAKAAIDIALHDLFGKSEKISLKKYFQTENLPAIYSTFTLGISEKDETQKKISEAKDFRIFKIKLGVTQISNLWNDKKIIENFLSTIKNSPSHWEGGVGWAVDVNQGWKDKHFALDMIFWLQEKGAFFVEQPLPKNMLDESAFLTEKSPVPIIADEAVQTLSDIEKIKDAFSGINIKLMKCGGLLEAKKMIDRAKELNMKILIGCMSESSCAVTAAAHLSPFCDWADLDGSYLINNDPFEGMKIKEGKIFVPDETGMGVRKIHH